MNTLQRGVTVAVTVLMLVTLLGILYREQIEKNTVRWEKRQSELFLYYICKEGVCSYDEYYLFCLSLRQLEGKYQVILREYQKEQDLDGNVYRYLITWEEISPELVTQGKYMFHPGSMVELLIISEKTDYSYYHRYCGIIRED